MNHAITVKDLLWVGGLGLIVAVIVCASVWAFVMYASMRND